MADLNQLKSFNNLKTITNSQGNNVLISNGISSLNFDGNISKIASLKKVSDIKIGDVVSPASFAKSNESFLITKIISETYTISSVETIVYFLYYLSDNDGEKRLIYGSQYTNPTDAWYNSYNGLQQLYTVSDDIDNVDVGTNGWFISNAGNAVFSNGFFRGRIEATDGIFSGKVTAGDSLSQVSIGKDLFNSQEFRDTDTPSVISVPSLTKTHGLMIDNNNYFFTFSGETSTNITRLDISDSTDTTYEYYAEFVYESPFTFNSQNRIDLNSNMTIFGLVDASEANSNIASLNRSFFPTSYTSDTKFKVKIPFPLTEYTSTYPYTISETSQVMQPEFQVIGYAKNVTFPDDIKIKSINLTREAVVTNKSLCKIYISDASSYSVGHFVTLSGFTTTSGSIDLTPLNQTFPITEVGSNYLILNTNRITAGNNYITGLGTISDFGQISKFKVGNPTSFMKYDSSLNNGLGLLKVTGEINATSGTFSGSVKTASSTHNISINGQLDTFTFTDNSGNELGNVFAGTISNSNFGGDGLNIQAGPLSRPVTSTQPFINLSPTSETRSIVLSADGNTFGTYIYMQPGTGINLGATNGVRTYSTTYLSDVAGSSSTSAGLTVSGSSQRVFMPATTNAGTTTTAANMFIAAGGSPNGLITKSTNSSRRYKNSITDVLDINPNNILDINVVQFKFNNDYLSENDPNYDKFVIGFIAEDVFEKYPLAADLNDDGTAENWNPRFLIPAMLKVIQNLEKRIALLEDK